MIRKNLLAIFMAGIMLATIFSAMNVSAGLTSSVSIQPKPIAPLFDRRLQQLKDTISSRLYDIEICRIDMSDGVFSDQGRWCLDSDIGQLESKGYDVFALCGTSSYDLFYAEVVKLRGLYDNILQDPTSANYIQKAKDMIAPIAALRDIVAGLHSIDYNSASTVLNLR